MRRALVLPVVPLVMLTRLFVQTVLLASGR